MRTTCLLLLVAAVLIVHGKFVKIENLHKEVNEDVKKNWNSDHHPHTNKTTLLRGYRHENGNAKLLHSVNEVTLDNDSLASGGPQSATRKQWKSFYYPHHYNHHTNGIPLAWSNGVINNNNLLSVGGGFSSVGTATSTATGGDLAYKPPLGGTSPLQCLLFGVMGLVTFLLNSVMALLLSVKLPGLDGLLGTLLGGVGIAALNKQDVAADTKGKHMEYVNFPETTGGNSGVLSQNPSADNVEYFDKN